jgi:hypothetical protein
VLEKSLIPWKLIESGYVVVAADPAEGQRIIAAPIEERLTLTSCGAFERLTEGSTKPVTEVRRHAGIARVLRYSFAI